MDGPDDEAERTGERPVEKPGDAPRAEDRQGDRSGDRPRDPRDRDGDGLPDTLRQRLEALVPEIVKRTFAAGMGAVFSTEEGLRKLAKDNLPAAAGFVAQSADSAKDKVLEVIARETREFLSTMNLTDEIAKILTTLSFEIKTEIRFIPNSERYGGVEPDVKAGVRLKRTDRPDDDKDRDARADRGDRERERGERAERDDEDKGGLGSRLGRLWRRGDSDRERDRDDADDPLDSDR
jgi:hypothetical protein